MASEADIPAPVCETKRELVEATNISSKTPNAPSTVEGENFLKTPSIGEVHCEVNYISSEACKDTEIVKDDTQILLLKNPKLDDQPEHPGKQSESTMNESHGDVENQSKTLEDITANDNELVDKVRDEDICRVESIENEKNTSTLLKEDLHVSPANSIAFNFDQDKEKITSSSEEQSTNVNLCVITDDVTEDKKVDVVDTKKEVIESFSTIVSSNPVEESTNAVLQGITSDKTKDQNSSKIGSNDETEEKSMIKVDVSETKTEGIVKKESEKTFLPQPLASEASDLESMVMHEPRIEGEESRKAELCEIERNTENMLLDIESTIEKPEEYSLNVPSEDIKTSDSSHEIETRSFEEQRATAYSQIILDQKTEDLNVAETEETHEIVSTINSNDKTEENSLIQVGGHLEKKCEKPSMIKAFLGNANGDELTVMDEVNPEDINGAEQFERNESDLLKEEVHDEGQLTGTTGFPEDQSVTKNPQGILDEKTEEETTDEADTNETNKEQQKGVIKVSNEKDHKNSSTQLDASRMKHDTYLEKEVEKPPLMKSSTGDIIDKSTTAHEAEIGNECMRKGGPHESDRNIDSTLLKREHLPEAPEDHKSSVSSEDIETTCSLDEHRLTANPQSIMTDKISDATNTEENVATKIPHKQVDCSQKEHDKQSEKESENSSLTDASTKDKEEELIKAELAENERNTISTSVNEAAEVEKHTDSLQAASDGIKASDSTHETKMSSDKEESQTSDPREIINDKTEETTADASNTETLVSQDIATNMLDGNNEKNSLIEEDGSQKLSLEEISKVKADENVSTVTQEKHEETLVMEEVPTESMQVSDEDIKASTLVQDRESSLEEQSLNTKSQGIMDDNAYRTNDATNMEKESQEDNNAATTTSYEDNEVNPQIQGDVSQLEQNEHIEKESENAPLTEGRARDTVENTLSKEEAEMEKPTDYVEVATEDMKASASSQDTETSTIVAAYSKEKTLEDVATKIPSWDNDDNLPIEMNGSLNPSLKEAVMGNTNDDESTNIHAKFEDDNLTKDGSFEDEKKKECTSIEKEVFSEPLQEADEDIKACTSCQDRETTFLEEEGSTMNSHKIEGDNEEKTSYVTNLKEETPDIKNAATTIPHENAEESSPSQVDSSQMEQKEHFEIKSENTSLTEKPTGDTIESTLKEEAHMEKPIAGFQMAIGDIEGSASRQDTVLNSKEAQVPPTDPQETSLDKTEGKITDASYAQEDESALKEASTGNVIDILSPIMHEVKFENEHSIKADLIGKEKCTEHISVNEKTSVESCSVEVQGLITDSKENTSKHKEDRTIDAAELEHETPQDKNIALTTTYKEAEGISLIQTDCFQIEHGEHVEKKSGNPSLTDAQTGDITGSTLLKEESDMQRLIDSVQVSPENINACTSIHDTETRSIEDRILAVDPQEILCDQTKEKTVDVTDTNEETLEVQEIAINVPIGKKEDNSPTKVDGSQEPSEASAENTAHHESFIDTDVVENEKSTVGTLIKEETSIESLQITEDIKACASGQDKEPSSQEKHSLVANSGEIIANKREDKTIDATNLNEETSKEKASKSIAVQIPSPNDSDVNTDTVLDIAEDPNRKQEKSSIIATESEEHMMTNNAHVANAISTTSEPSEQCIDKTDTEKMTVLNDGSAKVSTNENLVKTDPAESMEAGAQVPDEENKPESEQQDTEALEDILSSNVVSETNLTLNPVLESGKETQPEASNEEAQKQDEDLHISASVPDSSIQKLEKDVVSCPASAVDYGISPDENATKYTDCKEREVAGDANNSFSNDKILTEREQEETECKQEKALSVETVEEIKEPTSIPVANDLLPKSFIGTSGIDHSTTERQLSINEDPQTEKTPTGNNEDRKHDEDENKEEGERKISEFSPAALNIIEAGDKDGANTSLADLDDEAPEIIQRAPSATESREVENTSVGETSALISQCERDDSEHVHIDTEKKPDSNEVGFAPEESKSGHESKNQMLEYGTISKAGENLEATTTEIISETGKVNFSSEKIKEEDEDVRNDHLGSCKEAITESHLEDHAKQEKKTNTEEIIKVMKIPNETAKVSNDSEHAVDRAGDETREKLQVNSSTAAFLDDGDKSKGADENIICEAPPTNTIYTTIEDSEGKKENANTIMMQHKAEDTKSNLETSPVHEFTRGIESEKQAKKDETCSLDEVQMKDEVNLMHPARKGEAEATKAEDEDKNTYDRTDVSSGGDIHDAQEDNDNSTTKNRYCEEKCPNENREARVPTEGQEEEAIPKGPVLEQETEERKLEMTSQAVTKANEVDSQEAKIIDDESHVRAASENISVANIHQSSTEDPAQSDENQKQIGSSPISPVTRCSDDEIAEKDLPPQFAGLDSTGGTELQVTPTPSEDKHIVPEADHTNSMNPENTIGNSNIPSIDHGSSTECSQGEHELLKNPALEHKETAGQETTKSAEKTESKDIDKPSPSDLFQVSTKGTSQEAAPHIEHLRAEKAGEAELEDTKTDEDGGEEEEPSEQILSEVCAEAPIMVDAADAEVKAAAHKKSHNILSGVGSKVKHSIAKVKKAITGKSSHPKPASPK